MKPLVHQISPISKGLAYLNSPKPDKPGIIVAPTAAGKSFIIATLANEFKEPILVLQPSQELLEQNYEKLRILGGNATIYSASLGIKDLSHLTYATLGSVKKDVKNLIKMGVKTLLIDECHYKFGTDPKSEFMMFVSELKPTKVIGLTATPFRLTSSMDGSELKLLTRMRPNFFKKFIDVIQIQDIIANGFWSKILYETYKFDESGLMVNTSGSDFTDDSVKKAIKAQGINNNIYLRIKKLLKSGYPSVLVFVDSVESAITFTEHLPGTAYIAASMPKAKRKQIISNFKAGKIKVLFNFGILTTGFDYPDLRCIIMGRPTMSLALYYQIIGRGTRISPATGKESCLYIDYCNNVDRFGHIENLTLEEIEGWGWGMFNNDILMTNTLMDGLKKTKQQIIAKVKGQSMPVSHMWFGKHSGVAIKDLPKGYIEFMLKEFDFKGPKMLALKKELESLMALENQFAFVK